jgi:menaquinone reductase, multiheme cytochrome c subunit
VSFRGMVFLLAGFLLSMVLGWWAFPMLLYSNAPQPLQFSHNMHAGERVGLACIDCHSTDSQGRFQGIPATAKCAECHAATLTDNPSEKILVDDYVTPGKEIPWRIYARQPDNAYFPHAVHITLAQLKCEECHGPHGRSDSLRVYEANRVSGYSRDIWGHNLSGIPSESWEGMKMDRCVRCHASHQTRDGCIACHK